MQAGAAAHAVALGVERQTPQHEKIYLYTDNEDASFVTRAVAAGLVHIRPVPAPTFDCAMTHCPTFVYVLVGWPVFCAFRLILFE